MDQLYIVHRHAICANPVRKESHIHFDIVVTVFKVSVKRITSVLV